MKDLIDAIFQCKAPGGDIPIISHKLGKDFYHSVQPQEVCNVLQSFSKEDLECVESIVLAQPGDEEIKLRAHGEFVQFDNQIRVYALKMTKKKDGQQVFKLQCQGKTAKGKVREVTPDEAHDRVLSDVVPHEVGHAISRCNLGNKFQPGDAEEETARKFSIEYRKQHGIKERETYLGGFCAIMRE